MIPRKKSLRNIRISPNARRLDNDSLFSLKISDRSPGLASLYRFYVYPTKKYHIGYAGGINEHNVADKLRFLLSRPDVGLFWIDIESGVRTDDWFDTTKVRRIIEICKNVVKEQRKTNRNV